eukprot:97105-Pyramimonas_sp.AAC.1
MGPGAIPRPAVHVPQPGRVDRPKHRHRRPPGVPAHAKLVENHQRGGPPGCALPGVHSLRLLVVSSPRGRAALQATRREYRILPFTPTDPRFEAGRFNSLAQSRCQAQERHLQRDDTAVEPIGSLTKQELLRNCAPWTTQCEYGRGAPHRPLTLGADHVDARGGSC